MAILEWPDFIAPTSIEFWLENQSRSGGASILGNERIVAAPSARWRANLSFRLWGTRLKPERLLAWRAFASQLQGRAGGIVIGPWDQFTPARLAAAATQATATLSDGSIIDGLSIVQDASIAFSVGNTAINSSSLKITYGGPGQIMPGMYFGTDTRNLHLIGSVLDNGDGTLTIGFAPMLRAALPDGSPLNFDKPRCAMRLMADDTMRAKLEMGFTADTTLDLIEIF